MLSIVHSPHKMRPKDSQLQYPCDMAVVGVQLLMSLAVTRFWPVYRQRVDNQIPEVQIIFPRLQFFPTLTTIFPDKGLTINVDRYLVSSWEIYQTSPPPYHLPSLGIDG